MAAPLGYAALLLPHRKISRPKRIRLGDKLKCDQLVSDAGYFSARAEFRCIFRPIGSMDPLVLMISARTLHEAALGVLATDGRDHGGALDELAVAIAAGRCEGGRRQRGGAADGEGESDGGGAAHDDLLGSELQAGTAKPVEQDGRAGTGRLSGERRSRDHD
jgi:hypothetical protein